MNTNFNNGSIESQNELERFKTDIDFVSYLQNEGYKIDGKITSNSTTGLRLDSTGSKIFIKTNDNGHQIYSDKLAPLSTSRTGGTIIDWVQQYKGLNLGQARVELRKALNSGLPQVSYSQYENKPRKEVPVHSEEYFKFGKLHDTNYLNARGISNDTINSETFKGRVGQKDIPSETTNARGENVTKVYHHTVFPMYKNISGELSGLEVKNNYYSGSYPGSDKKTGYWKSNVPPDIEKPNVAIGEAAIDSMAHYQLHNPGNKKGILYIATNGEIGANSERIDILANYLEKRQGKIGDLYLMTDNDAAGVKYNINMIGKINVKETDITIRVTAESDKNYARIRVVADDPTKLEKFESDVKKLNNSLPLTSNHDNQYRNISTEKLPDGKYELSFLLNNRKDNLIPIETLAIKHRNSPFIIERAHEKDFARDLENKLGITRTEEFTKVNDKGIKQYKSVWTKGGTEAGKDKGIDGHER